MNRERFNEIWQSFVDKEMPLMISKGADYSNNEEALQNFKEAAQLADTKPAHVAFIYLMKHLSAIKNVVVASACDIPLQNLSWLVESDGKIKEGTLQKISDARNYLAIIAMCLEEETGIKCDFGEDKQI